jgi:hypothetical protein
MRLLIALAGTCASVLIYRWGIGLSSPQTDSYYLLRAVGWCERKITQLDAFVMRLKVRLIDRLELDQAAWTKLRARYVPEMS